MFVSPLVGVGCDVPVVCLKIVVLGCWSGVVLSGCGAVLNGHGVVLGGWGVGRRGVGVLGGHGGILSGGVGVFVCGCFL